MRAYEFNVHLIYGFQRSKTLNARDLFIFILGLVVESFCVLLMLTDQPPIDCSSGSERITTGSFHSAWISWRVVRHWLFMIESERVDSNELLQVQKRKV